MRTVYSRAVTVAILLHAAISSGRLQLKTSHSEFYRGVEVAAKAAAAASDAGPCRQAESVHAAMAQELDPLVTQHPRACAAGCSHCCHYPVGVAYGEALLLVSAIRVDSRLVCRVASAGSETRELPFRQLVGLSCPLLVDGVCAVYAVRPMPCRALASSDQSSCAAALERPVNVPRDEVAYWRGLGASDVLGAGYPRGLRELRSVLTALLRSPDPLAFLDARRIE